MLERLEKMLERAVVNKMRARLNGDEKEFNKQLELQKDIENSIMEVKGLL